ncbi:preprotein translocase subunit YajC [Lyticum sinuosum]|uniref:Sec translocon accessory complex subunit YajC n=1 Tax=Lyticum sinuosum TaxID=1332059 RepID=A0AAE5AHY2_9RICK|nr:preprotein translocase subunit YajC [Lyticum sinuosum]MDZ5761536.1 Preprotein translocase subunit YajC [Lyticum sinuosum]
MFASTIFIVSTKPNTIKDIKIKYKKINTMIIETILKNMINFREIFAEDSNNGENIDGLVAGGAPFNSNMIIMISMVAIFYFIVFRPQQKKVKEHNEMINQLKTGDKVMISNAISGVIVKKLSDKGTFIVEIANNVKIEVTKSSLSKLVNSSSTSSSNHENIHHSNKRKNNSIEKIEDNSLSDDKTLNEISNNIPESEELNHINNNSEYDHNNINDDNSKEDNKLNNSTNDIKNENKIRNNDKKSTENKIINNKKKNKNNDKK